MIQIKTFFIKHYVDIESRASIDQMINRFLRQQDVTYIDLKVNASVTANRESDLIYVLIYKIPRPKALRYHKREAQSKTVQHSHANFTTL